jgi:hypothetical protein
MPQKKQEPTGSAVEQKIVALAEQMGWLIGTVQARAEGWLDRGTLEEPLTRIREGAADVLANLSSTQRNEPSSTTPAKPRVSRRTSAAAARLGRAADPSRAPGKKHKPPTPSTRGVKHSEEHVTKLRSAEAVRRRRKY